MAVFIYMTRIACAEPAFAAFLQNVFGRRFGVFVIPLHDRRASQQNFAVFGNGHFDAGGGDADAGKFNIFVAVNRRPARDFGGAVDLFEVDAEGM